MAYLGSLLYGVVFKIYLLNIAVERQIKWLNLARRALQYKYNCIWLDEPPNFILDLFINDVTILNE